MEKQTSQRAGHNPAQETDPRGEKMKAANLDVVHDCRLAFAGSLLKSIKFMVTSVVSMVSHNQKKLESIVGSIFSINTPAASASIIAR